MDIAILSKDSLKIKIKKTTLVANPSSEISKTEADAIIATTKNIDPKKVADYRVIINSVGEYEVSGLKIVAQKVDQELIFNFVYETTDTLFAKASTLAKISSDKVKECPIVVINVDTTLPQNVLTSMEPRIIVLYGVNALEEAKTLGKEDPQTSSKVSFSEDKLPEETEIYLLS